MEYEPLSIHYLAHELLTIELMTHEPMIKGKWMMAYGTLTNESLVLQAIVKTLYQRFLANSE